MHSTTQAKVRQGRAGDSPAVDLWGWALTYLHEPAHDSDVLVFEARTRPGVIVPPHTEDNQESFYVLEGSFEVEIDGEPHRLDAGDYLVMAPGVLHSLRNAGDGWGRVLITTSPGAGHQRFFELMGSPLAPGADPTPMTAPPAFEPILAAGRECGLEFVPPPAG